MPIPEHLQRVDQPPQFLFFRARQHDLQGAKIVLQMRPGLHARNGRHIGALRQYPGDRQLRQ